MDNVEKIIWGAVAVIAAAIIFIIFKGQNTQAIIPLILLNLIFIVQALNLRHGRLSEGRGEAIEHDDIRKSA